MADDDNELAPPQALDLANVQEHMRPHIHICRGRTIRLLAVASLLTLAFIPLFNFVLPEYLPLTTATYLTWAASLLMSFLTSACLTSLYAILAGITTAWNQYAMPDDFLEFISQYQAMDATAWNTLVNQLRQQGYLSLADVHRFVRKERSYRTFSVNLQKPGARAILDKGFSIG